MSTTFPKNLEQTPSDWRSDLPILVHPISKVPLSEGELATRSQEQGKYFNLLPTQSELKKIFQHKYKTWEKLQKVGEISYQDDGPIGNFSHANYKPGIILGKVIGKFLRDADTYLDVGCGLLEVPIYISLQNNRGTFIGMDPIANGLPSLYKPRNFPFIQGIGDCIPFPDNSFEGVIFSSTLDHHIDPSTALREATRVTKEGGLIFMVETARPKDLPYYIWKTKKFIQRSARYNKFHAWAFTRKDLLFMASRQPLQIEYTENLPGNEYLIISRKLSQ